VKLVALAVAAAAVLAACGGDDAASSDLAGYRIEPVPEVADVALPDLTDGGAEFNFRAQPGNLLVVYFGYTNCPDFCPTTMANVKLARQRLDDPEQIEVAMVTIDPGRDLDILPAYVTSFVPDAHALGTDDFEALDRAAASFGVSYEVKQAPDGETEVAHTTSLYAVDDAGRVVLTWPFGVTIDQLAGDFRQLLADASD
jgi:protein SCO1/2